MAWPTTPVCVGEQDVTAAPHGVPRVIVTFGPNASASGGGGGTVNVSTPPPSTHQLFPRGKA